MDVAQVIAMFAALAAVWYAEQTVVETRALRREERVARLLKLVGEFGEIGTRVARGQLGDNNLTVARLRLGAALSATGEPLPECESLLDLQWPSYIRDTRADELEAECIAVVGRALNEVSKLLMAAPRRGRG